VKRTFIAFFVILITTASLAHAQATRTWVSGVGDDANPCSRTAPCKTFAGAISKTAAGGYINVIDPGGFGAVTITKSITIDGLGAQSGILTSSGLSGIIVNAAVGDTVILRNLSIEGVGTGANGVRVIAAGQVHVENCTIQNFTSNGILFQSPGTLSVTDVSIKGVRDQAVYMQSGHGNINRLTANGSGTGVLAGFTSVVTVKNSFVSGGEIGYAASYNAAAEINIEDSISTNNRYGVLVQTGAIARMSNVSVYNSSTAGVYNDGASRVVSFGNNKFGGNVTDGAAPTMTPVR
jgi:hypothetical protein